MERNSLIDKLIFTPLVKKNVTYVLEPESKLHNLQDRIAYLYSQSLQSYSDAPILVIRDLL
jgi:hypothetical protein